MLKTGEHNVHKMALGPEEAWPAQERPENGWRVGSPASILFGGFGIDVDRRSLMPLVLLHLRGGVGA
jgi:hypothetical protein